MRTLLALLPCLAPAVMADPPRVVSASPDHADVVDASVRELRITFDQDMNPGGRSLCGGGESFPKLTGSARWVDARTISVPIELTPGKAYALSVNCPSAANFRSVTGESAVPYPISFRTAQADQAPPALTADDAAELLGALRMAIDTRYSHRDQHGVDWTARFTEFRTRLLSAPTPAAFARAAAQALAINDDLHLSLEVGGVRLATGRRSIAPNADLAALAAVVPEWTPSRTGARGRWPDATGYIAIHAWTPESAKQALADLEALADVTRLVVDVRFNSGGDENAARALAARFVDAPHVYSRSMIRNPEAPGGWEGPFDRVVVPAKEAPRFAGPVAVLIGPACMSSNESFILMMRRAGERELFGARTWGSSGNPRPHDLGHTVTIHLPSWRDLTPDGADVEGVGITPDHDVAWPSAPGSDPVLEAALAWLRDPRRAEHP